jgi:hypothetical protein
MAADTRKICAAQFVRVSELLDHAFPKGPATPDHLAHHCERAEQALLTSIGRTGFTSDKLLADLLALSHRP